MRTRRLVLWCTIAGLVIALLPIDAARAVHEVAEPFRAYYDQHQGIRVLGRLQSRKSLDQLEYPARKEPARQLSDHERVAGDAAVLEQGVEPGSTSLQVLDPDGRVDENHRGP